MLTTLIATLAISSPWLSDDQAAHQFDAAMQSARQGDHAQAEILLRSVWLHPEFRHRAALSLERLDLDPRAEQHRVDDLHQMLGRDFRIHETRHFVILCDGTPGWSRSTGEVLERTYDQFERFAERLGAPLVPPRHKMVCVLFDEFDDYRAFAATHDNIRAPWVAGYYAAGPDRLVLYNEASSPAARGAEASLESIEQQIRQARTDARSADATHAKRLRDWADAQEKNLGRTRKKFDEDIHDATVARTVHEAAHQISFTRRLQLPDRPYPFWVSEGLACAFETDHPRHAFGPEHAHADRDEQWASMVADGAMIPMDAFLTALDAPSDDADVARKMYAQAYAVFTTLYRRDRDALGSYLQDLMADTEGPRTPQAHLALFESHFGDPERLGRRLERAVRR